MENESGVSDLSGKERQLKALEENRAATQYGGERPNPSSSAPDKNKPWSVRGSLKDLGQRPMDLDAIKDKSEHELIGELLPTKKASLLQIGAARKLVRFAKDGEDSQYITENVDGKLAQTNINSELAALQNMTDDQLYDIINRFNEQQAARNSSQSSGDMRGASGSEDRSPPAA